MAALAYVTIDTPDRRLDLAVPAAMPLAEVLPLLLQHGGADLAQRGLAHGGWLLRRPDGTALAAGETLHDQGVRDGEVLSLVHADRAWAPIAYDDVAVAVQESPDRGARWTPAASRTTGVVVGLLATVAGCTAALRSTTPSIATGLALAGVAAVAVGVAAVLARGLDETAGGDAMGSVGLAVAVTAGFLLGAAGANPSAGLAAAGVAALTWSVAAAVAFGSIRVPVLVGSVAGAAAVVGSIVWALTSLAGAAAVTVASAAIASGAAPALGVRLGGLPGQRSLITSDLVDRPASATLNREDLTRAVARTDEMILGLLSGLALVAVACGLALAASRGWPALALSCACALAFGLRARSYTVASHRLAGLAAAVSVLAPVVLAAAWHGVRVPGASVGLIASGLITVLAVSLGVSRASGSPYFARAAECLELGATAAIVPLVCANLGVLRPLIGV